MGERQDQQPPTRDEEDRQAVMDRALAREAWQRAEKAAGRKDSTKNG